MLKRNRRKRLLASLSAAALIASFLTVADNQVSEAATLPAGFVEEVVGSTSLVSVTAFDFLPDGRVLVAEKRGRLKLVDESDPAVSTTVLNIQDIVNTSADRGLMGLAVDPNFASTERVFTMYTYDPPETLDAAPYWDGNTSTTRTLENGGPNGDGQRVSRLSSWQLDSATNYTSVVAGSEVVLVGANSTWANIGDPFAYQTNYTVPWPCMTYSAGQAPEDGTPIVDCMPSDGVSHQVAALRFGPEGYLWASMGDGGAWNDVDLKALRALDPDHLAGKLLRIDSVTGAAHPGNPFYEGDGSSNQSRVWASGLRQPFRFTFDEAGVPYIADVGWNRYEEVNVGVAGGSYGWPCFEGGLSDEQIAAGVAAGPGTSVAQPGYGSLAECASVSAASQISPARAWCHNSINPGVCQEGENGLSAVVGVVYPGGSYPSQYEGLWYGDIIAGWIKVLDLDSGQTIDVANDFVVPVDFRIGPDGDIYYASRVVDEIIAIRYAGGTNQQPTAVASADVTSGLAPLTVNFDGTLSSDADGTIADWAWDFGDGDTGSGETVSHVYTTNGTSTATLTVTDDLGGTASADVMINVGNDAPVPTIESPADGAVFDIGSVIQLEGSATDAQDGELGDLQLSWTGFDHHNDHTHDDAYEGQGSLPVPINFEDHADDTHLEICLTATDLDGLTGTTCIDIFPTEVAYTLRTAPPGLDVIYNGQTLSTPTTITVPAGVQRSIDVPEPQAGFDFLAWSIDGPKSQTITTAHSRQMLTAIFDRPLITPGGIGGSEGDAGIKFASVPVRLHPAATAPVTVEWQTWDNGNPTIANAGVDYGATSGTVTFDPGETLQHVVIEINGDTDDEPGLFLGDWLPIVFLNPSDNAQVAGWTHAGIGLVIIGNDDAGP